MARGTRLNFIHVCSYLHQQSEDAQRPNLWCNIHIWEDQFSMAHLWCGKCWTYHLRKTMQSQSTTTRKHGQPAYDWFFLMCVQSFRTAPGWWWVDQKIDRERCRDWPGFATIGSFLPVMIVVLKMCLKIAPRFAAPRLLSNPSSRLVPRSKNHKSGWGKVVGVARFPCHDLV